ncbi:hypothetical protein [Streptomyces sp. NPDC046727]|uniref:hypothetical protein n=1 Tax=Streptomyces sp. NPDC046727 TaxID=3155373 RepID=UPI0033DDEC78
MIGGLPGPVRAHPHFAAVAREIVPIVRPAADTALRCGGADRVLPSLRSRRPADRRRRRSPATRTYATNWPPGWAQARPEPVRPYVPARPAAAGPRRVHRPY